MGMDWSDSLDYLEELERFLAPLRHTVFWNSCWQSYTDVARFGSILDVLRLHTTIEGKRILDSGCGNAGLLITLRQAGAAELVGIELDPNIYRLASIRTRGLSQIRIVQDDASAMKLRPESFDIIISLHVIEHVADFQSYLLAQAGLLKPGGLLLIACPNRLWPFEAHSKLPLIHYLPRPVSKAIGRLAERVPFLPRGLRDRGRTATLYEHNFTYFRLKRLLVQHGFEILEMNHPRYLISELIAHNLGGVARALRDFPLRWQWYAAIHLSKELNAVCRKTPPS
jgi:2-polyprenyl-3-methyl-5-hydroxy-6-metoxy-1,4-benzoquinol methylase